MKGNKENKKLDALGKDDRIKVEGLLDDLGDENAAKHARRWEPDEERAAMFEEDEPRPLLSVVGLVAGLLCWIALFALPKPGFENLHKQLVIMMVITLGAFLSSFFGRRQAFGMSVIGMLVSGGLMLFLVIALIVVLVTK